MLSGFFDDPSPYPQELFAQAMLAQDYDQILALLKQHCPQSEDRSQWQINVDAHCMEAKQTTALTYAAANGMFDVVHLLLHYNANHEQRDNHDQHQALPVQWAIMQIPSADQLASAQSDKLEPHAQCLFYLLSHGAKLNLWYDKYACWLRIRNMDIFVNVVINCAKRNLFDGSGCSLSMTESLVVYLVIHNCFNDYYPDLYKHLFLNVDTFRITDFNEQVSISYKHLGITENMLIKEFARAVGHPIQPNKNCANVSIEEKSDSGALPFDISTVVKTQDNLKSLYNTHGMECLINLFVQGLDGQYKDDRFINIPVSTCVIGGQTASVQDKKEIAVQTQVLTQYLDNLLLIEHSFEEQNVIVVLDSGCGLALAVIPLLAFAFQKGKKLIYIGLDTNQPCLNLAKEMYKDVEGIYFLPLSACRDDLKTMIKAAVEEDAVQSREEFVDIYLMRHPNMTKPSFNLMLTQRMPELLKARHGVIFITCYQGYELSQIKRLLSRIVEASRFVVRQTDQLVPLPRNYVVDDLLEVGETWYYDQHILIINDYTPLTAHSSVLASSRQASLEQIADLPSVSAVSTVWQTVPARESFSAVAQEEHRQHYKGRNSRLFKPGT